MGSSQCDQKQGNTVPHWQCGSIIYVVQCLSLRMIHINNDIVSVRATCQPLDDERQTAKQQSKRTSGFGLTRNLLLLEAHFEQDGLFNFAPTT